MRKLILSIGAVLLCFAHVWTHAHAQTTSVTASNLKMSGTAIANGTVLLTAVDSITGAPIGFADASGNFNAPGAFSATITAGAISGFSVPDACLSTPANIVYQAQLVNIATGKTYTYPGPIAGICGTSFALDHYGPPANGSQIQTISITVAAGAPSGACVSNRFYVNSSGNGLYTCVAGAWVQVSGAPASALLYQGVYASGTSYAASAVVSYGGGVYLSLAGSNAGNTPSISPSSWLPIGGALTQASLAPLLAPSGNAENNTFRSGLLNSANQIVSVADVGDSILCCVGPTAITNGPIAQMQNFIKLLGYSIYGVVVPIGGNSGLTQRPEWTASGTVTTVADLGPTQTGVGAFNSVFVLSGGATETLSAQTGDTLRLFMETNSSHYKCTVAIDGGSPVVVGPSSGPSSPTAYIATVASSLGSHSTVVSQGTDGTCLVYGAEWTTGSVGVEIVHLSHGYARSDAWGTATTQQLAFLAALPHAPDAFIDALGVNDATNGAGSTQSGYQTHMQNLINAELTINPLASIFVVDEENVSGGSSGSLPQSLIRSTEQALAITNSLNYGSVSDLWGSYATANANALMFTDGVHPTDKGGISFGNFLGQMVTGPTHPASAAGGCTSNCTFGGTTTASIGPHAVTLVSASTYTVANAPADSVVWLNGTVNQTITLGGSESSGATHTIINTGTGTMALAGINSSADAYGITLTNGQAVTVVNGTSNFWSVRDLYLGAASVPCTTNCTFGGVTTATLAVKAPTIVTTSAYTVQPAPADSELFFSGSTLTLQAAPTEAVGATHTFVNNGTNSVTFLGINGAAAGYGYTIAPGHAVTMTLGGGSYWFPVGAY